MTGSGRSNFMAIVSARIAEGIFNIETQQSGCARSFSNFIQHFPKTNPDGNK
jgi:hypothetical protein